MSASGVAEIIIGLILLSIMVSDYTDFKFRNLKKPKVYRVSKTGVKRKRRPSRR